MKNFFLTLTCLTSIISFGQRQLTGRIVDSETKKPVKLATILIENDTVRTQSNALGFFQLNVEPNDVLIIRCDGYNDGQVRVPASGGLQILLESNNMPQYEDGIQSLYEYWGRNFVYPYRARNKNVQGTVLISFEIDSLGEFGNVRLIKDIGEKCGEELLKVVKQTPGQWKPINRTFTYILPIRLRLENFDPFKPQDNHPIDQVTYESEKTIKGKLLSEVVITAQPKK